MELQLLENIGETSQELFAILGAMEEQELNQLPFEGSWTAAQVADHLTRSDRFLFTLFTGPTRKTARAPNANVSQLAAVFLNFDSRLKSPEMIIPDNRHFDKPQLMNDLTTIRASLLDVAASADLTRTTEIESPLGDSTLSELLHFHLYHTQRHLYQLGKICVALEG